MSEDETTKKPAGPAEWEARYETGDTPWDSGRPSKQLLKVLDRHAIEPCRALELGCGTGTNAIELARRGFAVTALDVSTKALSAARAKAAQAQVSVEFHRHDVLADPPLEYAADFLFDRGCWHCVRRLDVKPYQQLVAGAAQPGARLLMLAGNAAEQLEHGPPGVTEAEIRSEFEPWFEIIELEDFRFDAKDEFDIEPLAWSCLMVRRA